MNKKLTESAFELMLREAAINAEAESGREYEFPSEEIEFSKLHERKMKKLFLKEKRKENAPKRKKLIASVACIILILFVGTGTAILSVDAWRESVINYFFDKEKPYTEFNFNQSGGKSYLDDYVSFKYIPMGFEMISYTAKSGVMYYTFAKQSEYFDVTIEELGTSITIDTENADVEKIIVNGRECFFTTNHNINALLWSDELYSYTVLGNIEKQEIIKISEKIKILK